MTDQAVLCVRFGGRTRARERTRSGIQLLFFFFDLLARRQLTLLCRPQ